MRIRIIDGMGHSFRLEGLEHTEAATLAKALRLATNLREIRTEDEIKNHRTHHAVRVGGAWQDKEIK